jgi:hypothetical protein
MYIKLRRKMQGVFTLASKDGSRIFGLGIDRLTGEDILIYNKGNKIRINLTMEIYKKNIDVITCGEVSYSSKMLYFAGSMDKQAMIGAVKFD